MANLVPRVLSLSLLGTRRRGPWERGWPFIFFLADLTRSVYFHCHYFPYLVLVFLLKFNCSLGNRYFWRCMLEHTKRQDKWRILQHALSSYVYNRSLFAVFTKDKLSQRTKDCFFKKKNAPLSFGKSDKVFQFWQWKPRHFLCWRQCSIDIIESWFSFSSFQAFRLLAKVSAPLAKFYRHLLSIFLTNFPSRLWLEGPGFSMYWGDLEIVYSLQKYSKYQHLKWKAS